jgi:hypothetical protein
VSAPSRQDGGFGKLDCFFRFDQVNHWLSRTRDLIATSERAPTHEEHEGRLMSKKTERTPHVGIVYVVGRKLWIDATPLGGAGNFGDFAIRERDHHEYWAQLVSSGAAPDAEYEEYPRGRVAYNTKTGKYTLLADRCILGRKSLVRKILSRLHLPPNETEIGTDSHYRCFRCLGRERLLPTVWPECR